MKYLRSLISSKYTPFLILVVLTLITRFLFLGKTAPFIWDEARDINYVHHIVNEKPLTLIGAFSERGVEVSGSFYYYLILPLTVLLKYNPLGPVLTMALLGSVNILIFYLIFKKILGKEGAFGATLSTIGYYPFLVASRWAWNPYPVLFFNSLALFFWLNPTPLSWFAAGVSLAISFNIHFLSIFTSLGLLIVSFILTRIKRLPFRNVLALMAGFLTGSIPLLVFELRHFFFSKMFLFSQTNFNDPTFGPPNLPRLLDVSKYFLLIYSVWLLPIVVGRSSKLKIDSKVNGLATLALLTSVIGLFVLIFLRHTNERYFYFPVPFFVFGIIGATRNLWRNKRLSLAVGVVLLVSGLLIYLSRLTPSWQRSIPQFQKTIPIIEQDLQVFSEDTKFNVAALQGPEQNLTGDRYRFILQLRGNKILDKREYHLTQVLYVISGTGDTEKIYSDQAFEIRSLSPFEITKSWQIDSSWYVHRVERRPEKK